MNEAILGLIFGMSIGFISGILIPYSDEYEKSKPIEIHKCFTKSTQGDQQIYHPIKCPWGKR